MLRKNIVKHGGLQAETEVEEIRGKITKRGRVVTGRRESRAVETVQFGMQGGPRLPAVAIASRSRVGDKPGHFMYSLQN
jgi:hypothetical protein